MRPHHGLPTCRCGQIPVGTAAHESRSLLQSKNVSFCWNHQPCSGSGVVLNRHETSSTWHIMETIRRRLSSNLLIRDSTQDWDCLQVKCSLCEPFASNCELKVCSCHVNFVKLQCKVFELGGPGQQSNLCRLTRLIDPKDMDLYQGPSWDHGSASILDMTILSLIRPVAYLTH